MKETRAQQNFHFLAWGIGVALTIVMTLAWWISRKLSPGTINEFDIFPLLGLVAFGLMWSHYTLGSVRRLLKQSRPKKDMYWSISSGLVLALVILHPALLNYGLISDGLGLPPASYQAAYGTLAPYLMLGTICLFIFLSFELKRWFGKKNWWNLVEYAQIGAMAGIFIHALMLGRELDLAWFKAFWWLLGLTLVASWVYNYRYDKSIKEATDGDQK